MHPLPSQDLKTITSDYTTTTSTNANYNNISEKETSPLERFLKFSFSICVPTHVSLGQWEDPPLHYWKDHLLEPRPSHSHSPMESYKEILPPVTSESPNLKFLWFHRRKLLFYDSYSTKRPNYVTLFAPLEIKGQHVTDTR